MYMADTAKARRLRPDGEWERVHPADDAEPFNAQEWFVAQARAAVRQGGD
jgi:polyphosphate kinase